MQNYFKVQFATSFIMTVLAVVFLAQTAVAFNTPDQWKILGKRTVKFSLDHDEIPVTVAEGTFTKIQFRVKRAGINMHRCVVHFADGSSQEIEMKENFSAGSSSRVVDLEGNKRIINRISFWYDTKNKRAKTAIVEVWGKK
ncbi:MAG TPA: DUF2541 family protein [Saprospiraceae bacterium]|nr:DUF2541 family protein [Saprospiraceae bacterium]